MPTDPNAPIPSDVPTYSTAPGLQVSMSSGFTHSTLHPKDKIWVSDWIQADEAGTEIFRWAYFNRFEVDLPEVAHTEWRVTPQSTPQIRVVELGDGTCQQEQATVETEYSFKYALLRQYYEQWVTDVALRDYYATLLSTEATATAGAVDFAGLFGSVAYESATAGIASGTLTTTTGTLGGAGAAGAVGAAGGLVAVGAAGLSAFLGTTAIMSKIVKDTETRSSGWAVIGKWKYDETPTGNTRTTWAKIGQPYPCAKKRPVTGGDPAPKDEVGVGGTDAIDPGDRAKRWRLFWWLVICGLIVLVLIIALIAFLISRSGVPQGSSDQVDTDDGPIPAGAYGTSPAWCSGVWHFSSPIYPGSLSWFMLLALAVPDDDGELFPGTAFEVSTPGADVPSVSGIVGSGGEIAAVIPVSSFADYAITGIELTAPDGSTAALAGPFPTVSVGQQQSGLTCTGDAAVGQQLIASTMPDPVLTAPAAAEAFIAEYESWHATGNIGMLVGTLHPAVIQRYGLEQCEAYLNDVAGTISDISIVNHAIGIWDYPRDGMTTQILDGLTLTVDAQFAEEPGQAEFHLAPYGGALRWFTDCGDPAA